LFSQADSRNVVKKSVEYYKGMAMDPESWKTVTKSPAALKTFKRDLRDFRDEMTAQK